MPFPRQTLTALRTGAMQDITASDLPNADGFLRRSALRVMAWVQAGLAYLHFGYLDWISLQSTPFTSTDEYLEGWAALAPTPVLREAPQLATGTGQWSGTATADLPSGTLCTRPDLTQYVTTADAVVGGGGTVTAPVQAVVAGSAGNTDAGTPLTFSTAVENISPAGFAVGPIIGGTDIEQDGPLRTRMLESYAAPPHGGNEADYVTWALTVPGVTRAWCAPGSVGMVTVYVMLDDADAAFGGFPQGTNGAATLETRWPPATGDQLTVADTIYPLRPVTTIVVVVAPVPQAQDFTIAFETVISTDQQTQVESSLAAMFIETDSPLADGSIDQSDCVAAIAAVGGLPSFAITSPNVWPIASGVGSLFVLGTVTYP